MDTQIIKRAKLEEIAKHLQKPEITVLLGARQVGKTTILESLQEKLMNNGVSEGRIKKFNLDREDHKSMFLSQTDFISYLKEEISKKKEEKLYVFIDEAQRIKQAGRFFKGIYDAKLPIKLVLTGSSALDIKTTMHEPLTGRKRVFIIHPFSFHEYLSAVNKDAKNILEAAVSQDLQKSILLSHYSNYLVSGGYPAVVMAENEEERKKVLAEIVESYLYKDIIAALNVGDPEGFKNLMKALAVQIGSTVNINELSGLLGISRITIKKYLYLLEQTYVLFPVRPFYSNARKEMRKMSKWYWNDTGLRNYLLNNMLPLAQRADKGMLLENAIAQELSAHFPTIKFWRTKSKAEVDFIVEKEGQLFPVEVKQRMKTTRALGEFQKAYPVSKTYLVNLELEATEKKGIGVFPWNVSKALAGN